jgi:transcriptional regulator with XRE-family HTH domain
MARRTALGRYLAKKGLSRAAFARAADVPAPMVCLWAAGKRRPGLENALKIEAATEHEVPASYWTTVEAD